MRMFAASKFNDSPKYLCRLAKAIILLAHPHFWRCFWPRYWTKINTFEHRVQNTQKLIRFLGRDRRVTLLSRSAGGRVASIIADQLGIERVICLGYPFKHPDLPAEPERYQHLATLKTPFLIIQGKRDAYGGQDILETYRLSPSIEVYFIDTDHDFLLSPQAWAQVLQKITDAIGLI